MARPEIYTEEIAEKICFEIATSGKSLKTICLQDGMPSVGTVLNWLKKDTDGFLSQYTRAKEQQADHLVDEMLDIADDSSGDVVTDEEGNERENREFINRSRLRVDTRKWIASKLKPKKYSDKITQEITGPEGSPLQFIFNAAPGCEPIPNDQPKDN
jgi:hypothetical protein